MQDNPPMATTTDAPSRTAAVPSARISPAQLQALAARVRTEGPREPIEVDQPFTGALLGTVPRCAVEDVAPAVERARAAQAAWARVGFDERRRTLLRYHDLVLARQDEVLDLLQLESGKARRHAFEEVLDVALVARYYANTAARHLATHRRRGALPLLTAAYEHRHPLGVVAIIAPWNYPLTLSVSDALPALAAGNAVVLKPDGQTPFTALWGFALLEEAGLPEGLVQVLTGSGAELGPHLIEGSDYLMFTGSTGTGRPGAEQAGRRRVGAPAEVGRENT